MNIVRFTDGPTRYETWELPDASWEDFASAVDRFLSHAIRAIAAEYDGSPVEWLEVSYWRVAGRLIVFPSKDGSHRDRVERLCFELASRHLEAESHRINRSFPEDDRDAAWEAQAVAVWRLVGGCFADGNASRELAAARRTHRMRVTGYDYNLGEGPLRLTEDGGFI